MKKKFISLLLASAMVTTLLAGCGSKEAETQAPAADTTAKTEEKAEEKAEEPAEEPAEEKAE